VVKQAKIETTNEPTRVREEDLRNARDGDKSGPGAAAGDSTQNTTDYQLARAIDPLKGISLYNVRVTN
jgi:hypothetical protein